MSIRTDILDAFTADDAQRLASDAWNAVNDQGGGDNVPDGQDGDGGDDCNDCTGYGDLVVRARTGEEIAAYDDGETMTLVGWTSGLLAVTAR